MKQDVLVTALSEVSKLYRELAQAVEKVIATENIPQEVKEELMTLRVDQHPRVLAIGELLSQDEKKEEGQVE